MAKFVGVSVPRHKNFPSMKWMGIHSNQACCECLPERQIDIAYFIVGAIKQLNISDKIELSIIRVGVMIDLIES